MVPTIILAALGAVEAAKTAAAHAIPPGLHVALSHVPSGSEAMEVLKRHLSILVEAIRHGLHLGLGK